METDYVSLTVLAPMLTYSPGLRGVDCAVDVQGGACRRQLSYVSLRGLVMPQAVLLLVSVIMLMVTRQHGTIHTAQSLRYCLSSPTPHGSRRLHIGTIFNGLSLLGSVKTDLIARAKYWLFYLPTIVLAMLPRAQSNLLSTVAKTLKIANSAKNLSVTGDITVNGQPMSRSFFLENAAYVPQEDRLWSALTGEGSCTGLLFDSILDALRNMDSMSGVFAYISCLDRRSMHHEGVVQTTSDKCAV